MFDATLFEYSSAAAGGHKYSIDGTATAINITYDIVSIDFTSSNIDMISRITYKGGSIGEASNAQHNVKISGYINVNTTGTIGVYFAQQSSNVNPSYILEGSSFIVNEVN